jgi:hypothetical protein
MISESSTATLVRDNNVLLLTLQSSAIYSTNDPRDSKPPPLSRLHESAICHLPPSPANALPQFTALEHNPIQTNEGPENYFPQQMQPGDARRLAAHGYRNSTSTRARSQPHPLLRSLSPPPLSSPPSNQVSRTPSPTPSPPSAMAQQLAGHMAEIEKLLESKSGSGSGNERTLNQEYKSMTTRKGGKSWPKTCGGPGICTNMLCEHLYAVPP